MTKPQRTKTPGLSPIFTFCIELFHAITGTESDAEKRLRATEEFVKKYKKDQKMRLKSQKSKVLKFAQLQAKRIKSSKMFRRATQNRLKKDLAEAMATMKITTKIQIEEIAECIEDLQITTKAVEDMQITMKTQMKQLAESMHDTEEYCCHRVRETTEHVITYVDTWCKKSNQTSATNALAWWEKARITINRMSSEF
jgi:hypothetical protein